MKYAAGANVQVILVEICLSSPTSSTFLYAGFLPQVGKDAHYRPFLCTNINLAPWSPPPAERASLPLNSPLKAWDPPTGLAEVTCSPGNHGRATRVQCSDWPEQSAPLMLGPPPVPPFCGYQKKEQEKTAGQNKSAPAEHFNQRWKIPISLVKALLSFIWREQVSFELGKVKIWPQ